MKNIEVVAAIMICGNKILCVQRGDGEYEYVNRKWEFPGGKVETGESLESALKREIKEELGAEIREPSHYLTVEHQYPDFFLTLHSFICPAPSESITLTEHIDHRWLNAKHIGALDWADADVPLVKKLIEDYACDSDEPCALSRSKQ